MKKALLVIGILLLLAVLAAGGYAFYRYEATGEDTVPKVSLAAFGAELPCTAWRWSTPVLGGLAYKDFSGPAAAPNAAALRLGSYEALPREMALPEGFDTVIRLIKDGAAVYEGPGDGWDWALAEGPGEYEAEFVCSKVPGDAGGTGSFSFACSFVIVPPPQPEPPEEVPFVMPAKPEFVPGNVSLAQGDIFSMEVRWLPEGVTPVATTSLGLAVFSPGENGCWFAAVPVGNTRAVGSYPVQVQAGEYSWDAEITVEKFDFEEQNLIIDNTSPQITEANSEAAYAEYRAKIPPLFYTWDEDRYWEGLFIEPAEGWISTNFGEIRYTNGDYSNPRSHNGMDIAATEGSPVIAPNNGRVVLAEYLLNTGWTIAIEHGGGLKSYYFHLLEISVEPGQMVEKGESLGLVGSTGYSTGAHLHFEMRIGEWPVSPQMLFLPEAGLYSAEGNDDG